MYQLVLNGLGAGSSLSMLMKSRGDFNVLRPWLETDRYGRITGRSFVSAYRRDRDGSVMLTNEGKPILDNYLTNAAALLTTTDWQRIDEEVAMAAKKRVRFWGDLRGTVPLNLDGGLGNVALVNYVGDINPTATISMDPIRKGERFRPELDQNLMPLPVIHSDGSFSLRQRLVFENSRIPLDTTSIRAAARVVGENAEQLALGTAASYTYAGGTVYGAMNHPNRFTKTLTVPTGLNGATQLAEIGDMANTLRVNFYPGPYAIYYSPGWVTKWMLDYATTYPGSIFQRLQTGIPQIAAWRELQWLTTDYKLILVDMTTDVVEAVQFLPLTTVQWQEQGGFEECFKVLAGWVPRFKADANGTLGVVHGATP